MNVEQVIARHYLESEGLGTDFVETIHPADEMYRVLVRHPGDSPERHRFDYFRTGREALRCVQNALAALGRTLGGAARVLEFGCGFGRVTRHLVGRVARERLVAADADAAAVEFVRSRFGLEGWVAPRDPAAASIEGRFDVILALAVFSHLPESRFEAWLRALTAALEPAGVLLFSTHGEGVLPAVPKDPGGFTFVPRSETDRLDPREYGTAFVRPDVGLRKARDAGAGEARVLTRELWLLHDLYLTMRRPQPGLAGWRPASGVGGRIERIEVEPDGLARLAGWAADLGHGAPLESVDLCLDDRPLGPARLGETRERLAAAMGRDDFRAAGWILEAALGDLPFGGRVISARGRSREGAEAYFDYRYAEIGRGRRTVFG